DPEHQRGLHQQQQARERDRQHRRQEAPPFVDQRLARERDHGFAAASAAGNGAPPNALYNATYASPCASRACSRSSSDSVSASCASASCRPSAWPRPCSFSLSDRLSCDADADACAPCARSAEACSAARSVSTSAAPCSTACRYASTAACSWSSRASRTARRWPQSNSGMLMIGPIAKELLTSPSRVWPLTSAAKVSELPSARCGYRSALAMPSSPAAFSTCVSA